MNYFSEFIFANKKNKFLVYRRFRERNFEVGDVLSLFFKNEIFNFFFEGICIAVKNPKNVNCSFTLRNVLFGVIIEFVFSFFFNRAFFFKLHDYKRKNFFYNHSKIYYIREQVNKQSKVR